MLKLGLGISLTNRIGAAGGAAPYAFADSYANGENGFIYDPSQSVLTSGDPLTGATDRINSNDATQTTAANQPVYDLTAGVHSFQANGVDQWLRIPYFPIGSDYTAIISCTDPVQDQAGTSGIRSIFAAADAAAYPPGEDYHTFEFTKAGGIRMQINGDVVEDTYTPDGSPAVFTFRKEGTTGKIFRDGVEIATGTLSTTTGFATGDYALFASPVDFDTGKYAKTDLYHIMFIDRALTAQEQADAEALSATFAVPASELTFTRANVIANVSDAGRTSTETLKIPGVDTLPTGATFDGSSTVTVSGDDVVLEDWSFQRLTGSGLRCIVRQCDFEDPQQSSGTYPVSGISGGWTFEHNDFYNDAGPEGSQTLILAGGTDLTIRKNRFFHFAYDGLKLTGQNFLVEENTFGPANNLSGTTEYDAGTFYPIGSFVTVSGQSGIYKKISTAPAGTSPTDGDDWQNLDPHVDIITIFGGSGVIRYNYFNQSISPIAGATQIIRTVRNTGNPNTITPVLIYGNVSETWPTQAAPFLSSVVRPYTGSVYSSGDFCSNANETIFYQSNKALSGGAFDPADWDEVRDLNANDEFVWAHNIFEPNNAGNTGLAGRTAPITTAGNKNEAGGTVLSRQVIADIPEPANIGDEITYAPLTSYGPAQVFTITPTAFSGTIKSLDSGDYFNVCAIRVGIQLVAWFTSTSYYVEKQSGCSITDNLDGSYTLRIYDSSGDPMSGPVTVPAGAATVVAEADEVTTGPAWGTEPSVVLSNDLQNSFEHTVIETVGQTDNLKLGSTSTETLSLEALGLTVGDIGIAFISAAGANRRFPDILTTGYSEYYEFNTGAPTWGVEHRVGNKTQTNPVDQNVQVDINGDSGTRLAYGLRLYRNATSVTEVETNGYSQTISPPQVTVSSDNSVVLVMAFVGHGQSSEVSLTGTGYVNEWTEYSNDANSAEISAFLGEIEQDTGTYTPPTIAIGGGVDLSWTCAVFVIEP